MKPSFILMVAASLALIVLAAFAFRAAARRMVRHDPVEYYSRWSAFYEPVRLSRKITREEAAALSASGYAYLAGHYDADNRLVKVIKYSPGGEVFFEIVYAYGPTGTLLSATTTARGRTTVDLYDARGRRVRKSAMPN